MTTSSITVTERAAQRIAQIVCNEPDKKMFRISVEGGGCSGFEYRFDLVPKAEPEDAVIEHADAKNPGQFTLARLSGGLGDRLRRRPAQRVVQDQESERDRRLRLRHKLLGLKPILHGSAPRGHCHVSAVKASSGLDGAW